LIKVGGLPIEKNLPGRIPFHRVKNKLKRTTTASPAAFEQSVKVSIDK